MFQLQKSIKNKWLNILVKKAFQKLQYKMLIMLLCVIFGGGMKKKVKGIKKHNLSQINLGI
jgi:hypothetical protein